jgi:hypothetical protein
MNVATAKKNNTNDLIKSPAVPSNIDLATSEIVKAALVKDKNHNKL